MRTFLAVCLAGLAMAGLSYAQAPLIYEGNIDLQGKPMDHGGFAQWDMAAKVGNTGRVKLYTFSGTNVFNPTNYTVTFNAGKTRGTAGQIAVTAVATNPAFIEFTFASNNLAYPFEGWYSAIKFVSGATVVSQPEGLLSSYGAPEVAGGGISMSYAINWALHTFLNASNGPTIGDGTTITSTVNSNGQLVLSTPASSGDITAVTSATPAYVYILGGVSGAAGVGVSNVATAAQGSLADTAIQPAEFDAFSNLSYHVHIYTNLEVGYVWTNGHDVYYGTNAELAKADATNRAAIAAAIAHYPLTQNPSNYVTLTVLVESNGVTVAQATNLSWTALTNWVALQTYLSAETDPLSLHLDGANSPNANLNLGGFGVTNGGIGIFNSFNDTAFPHLQKIGMTNSSLYDADTGVRTYDWKFQRMYYPDGTPFFDLTGGDLYDIDGNIIIDLRFSMLFSKLPNAELVNFETNILKVYGQGIQADLGLSSNYPIYSADGNASVAQTSSGTVVTVSGAPDAQAFYTNGTRALAVDANAGGFSWTNALRWSGSPGAVIGLGPHNVVESFISLYGPSHSVEPGLIDINSAGVSNRIAFRFAGLSVAEFQSDGFLYANLAGSSNLPLSGIVGGTTNYVATANGAGLAPTWKPAQVAEWTNSGHTAVTTNSVAGFGPTGAAVARPVYIGYAGHGGTPDDVPNNTWTMLANAADPYNPLGAYVTPTNHFVVPATYSGGYRVTASAVLEAAGDQKVFTVGVFTNGGLYGVVARAMTSGSRATCSGSLVVPDCPGGMTIDVRCLHNNGDAVPDIEYTSVEYQWIGP